MIYGKWEGNGAISIGFRLEDDIINQIKEFRCNASLDDPEWMLRILCIWCESEQNINLMVSSYVLAAAMLFVSVLIRLYVKFLITTS